MTSILSTIQNVKDWYEDSSVMGRVNSLQNLGSGFTYIPLIDESWVRPSTIDTYNNGGDGLSIGTPATPGFYYVAQAGDRNASSNFGMYYTWKTIDIENFSEFYIWIEDVQSAETGGPPWRNLIIYPLFAIENGHDKFKLISGHYFNSAWDLSGETIAYFQCYQGNSVNFNYSEFKGAVVGISPYQPDHFQNFDTSALERSNEIPRCDPFPCMGKYMKLGFGNYTVSQPRGISTGLQTLGKLGVLIR